MINKRKIAVCIIIMMLCTSASFAHSGRTDSSGGHKDNKNKSGLGSYHYHHGQSAHLHPNGVCEYRNSNISTTDSNTLGDVGVVTSAQTTDELLKKVEQDRVKRVELESRYKILSSNRETIKSQIIDLERTAKDLSESYSVFLNKIKDSERKYHYDIDESKYKVSLVNIPSTYVEYLQSIKVISYMYDVLIWEQEISKNESLMQEIDNYISINNEIIVQSTNYIKNYEAELILLNENANSQLLGDEWSSENKIILNSNEAIYFVDKGQEKLLTCVPQIVNGEWYIPISDVFKLFGYDILWKPSQKQIELSFLNRKLTLDTSKRTISDGKDVKKIKLTTYRGKNYIELNTLGTSMNISIFWNENARTITFIRN